MPKTFWDTYQLFLLEARHFTGRQEEPEVVRALRARQKKDPEGYSAWLTVHGWGPAHVERHLLYVADYPEEVRELLRRGYPVRQIPLRHLDTRALQEALEKPDWRVAVDQLFRRKLLPDWITRPVWIYSASPALRAREGLARPVADALIEVASPAGGFVVDPMAGTGEVVRAAHASGRRAWGGDLQPSSPDVVQANVHDLLQFVPPASADLLVLHPPTFRNWSRQDPAQAELGGVPVNEHYALYLEFVAGLLISTKDVVKPGGQVALIARPPRRGHVFHAAFELALGEQGLELQSYHLAVSRDGHEDWHLFLAVQGKG
jgi:hypothetical protein